MTKDSTNITPQCPGVGAHAVLGPRTGFYGCPICKAPQGVILRAGGYIVPGHEFGSIHREPGDPTFVIRTPEHGNFPLLNLAAQHGLPKDMVIDLLCQGFMPQTTTLSPVDGVTGVRYEFNGDKRTGQYCSCLWRPGQPTPSVDAHCRIHGLAGK